MSRPSSHSSEPRRSPVSSWLRRSVAALLGRKTAPVSKPAGGKLPPVAPTKAETSLLPPFPGLPPESILVPQTRAECEAAAAGILAAGLAGFDTEARPTFKPGEKSTGPHVVQFALTDRAYIFQLHRPECQETVAALVASERVLKVGFGLANDHGQIRRRLGVALHHVLDLDRVFRQRGYRGQIGVRGAMGVLLQLSFPKSKSTTTSNWAAKELTPRQLRYAANDAYAALKIMEALALKPDEIALKPHPPKKIRRKRHAPGPDKPAGRARTSRAEQP